MEKANTINLEGKYISKEAILSWIWANLTYVEPIDCAEDAGKISILHSLEEFIKEFDITSV